MSQAARRRIVRLGGLLFMPYHRPMDKELIIKQTSEHIRQLLEGEGSGHDWWHIYRVWNMAKHLAKAEGADFFIVELTALLHDIADWKFHDGDDTVGPKQAREWLENINVDEKVISHVCQIIKDLSFRCDCHPRAKSTTGPGIETITRMQD